MAEQIMLNVELPQEAFMPTAAQLRIGDVLEGHSGRAFPRPLTILGIQNHPQDDTIQIIYREKVSGEDLYGAITIPTTTDVSLQPPF